MDVVVTELPLVAAIIFPKKLSLSMLLPLPVLSLVDGLIRPGLLAIAVLLISLPVALIPRST
jgi:hypothetical protein